MDSSNLGRSETLINLAQRLRLCNQNLNFGSSIAIEDPRVHDSAAQTVPQEGTKSNIAAVLICLFEDESGDLRVILTKRSSTMSTHSGEVALPGGRRDEGDADAVATALREAQEEIGLNPSIVEVVTVLEPFHNKRGITVFPVVGIIWEIKDFNPIPNLAEVESIFDAPLEMFLKDENRREEEREWMEYKYLLHFFDHRVGNESYVIWALTAGILIKLASIVYQRSPAFEERMPPFWIRNTR